MQLSGELQTCSVPSSSLARLFIFTATMVVRLMFFKTTTEMGEKNVATASENTTKLTVFTEVSHFSLINAPCDVANLWLISRVLKKLILTMFASLLIAFHSENASPFEVRSKMLLTFVFNIIYLIASLYKLIFNSGCV